MIEVRGMMAKPVILGREEKSSNIRMEGWAIWAAMRRAAGEPCEIHTDSQFWINVITKWMKNWKNQEWQKKNGEEIVNLDIVKKLDELYNPKTVELVWVQGHAGTRYNELADKWAKKARKGATL